MLSVIVPSYNHATFIEERLSSIKSQSCNCYELIIIDDASQDGSVEAIKSCLKGVSYKLIIHNINSKSPHGGWATAIALAKGRYLWIAESDDCCSSNFAEILISHLEINNASIAFARTVSINEKGHVLGDKYWPELHNHEFFSKSQVIRSKKFLKDFMSARNCIPNVSSAIFKIEGRKDDVLCAAQEASKYKFAGDWIFWINLLSVSNDDLVCYECRPLAYHRNHANTTRSAASRQYQSQRLIEYSLAINMANHDLSRSLAKGWLGCWDWTFAEYHLRYKPSLIEKLIGHPFQGFHRIGYFSYKSKRLFMKAKYWIGRHLLRI
jgi:glycosyltransferase involved in cell wall biosynthesis